MFDSLSQDKFTDRLEIQKWRCHRACAKHAVIKLRRNFGRNLMNLLMRWNECGIVLLESLEKLLVGLSGNRAEQAVDMFVARSRCQICPALQRDRSDTYLLCNTLSFSTIIDEVSQQCLPGTLRLFPFHILPFTPKLNDIHNDYQCIVYSSMFFIYLQLSPTWHIHDAHSVKKISGICLCSSAQ